MMIADIAEELTKLCERVKETGRKFRTYDPLAQFQINHDGTLELSLFADDFGKHGVQTFHAEGPSVVFAQARSFVRSLSPNAPD